MASFREPLAPTKAEIRETDPAEAEAAVRDRGAVVLDVREPDEHSQGAIPGSIHIPRGNLESNIENRVPDHDTPIVVQCASGVRSAFAAKTLAELGYTDVASLKGGFNRWKDEGRPWSERQTLHNVDRIGERKVDSAKKTLVALNPDVDVVTFDVRLGADNVVEIFEQFDVVVDGTDNFPTRYLVNDASLKTRTPVVHGSIFRFEGQVSAYLPYDGPCYRCQVPEPPPAELAPSCAEAGVLGVLPGIIGSLQAMEAIKLLLGIGEPLVGRLIAYDALEESFRTFKFNVDPENETTYANRDRIVIAEYDELCMPHPLAPPA